MVADEGLLALGALVRRRFPAADGLRYGHACDPHSDTILWQVLAGRDVIWDAGPAVIEQIPEWHRLAEAAELMAQVIPPEIEGDWLVLRLP